MRRSSCLRKCSKSLPYVNLNLPMKGQGKRMLRL